MKIAVVHDYFIQMGGAEKVAEEMYRMFPNSSVFATAALPDRLPGILKGVNVHTTWIQHLPKLKEYYRLYFLLYPFAVNSMDLTGYDLVLSSSSGYAKGVRTSPDAIHVCYCHTPTRWIWSFDSYSSRESFGSTFRSALNMVVNALKDWDLGTARQPDHFIANSAVVAERIRKAYGRASEIIYPPIDVDRFRLTDEQDDYYVILARLVPYKRIDLAVQACTMLNKKLVVIGGGPDRARLEQMAGPTIKFMGRLSDEEVEHYVSRCKALIFPGEEDFGMAPLEVAAAGRPTIAFRAGGATETVIDGQTGVFFDTQEPESVVQAIEQFERQDWSKALIREHALKFSVSVFQERYCSFLRKIGVSEKVIAEGTAKVGASLLQPSVINA